MGLTFEEEGESTSILKYKVIAIDPPVLAGYSGEATYTFQSDVYELKLVVPISDGKRQGTGTITRNNEVIMTLTFEMDEETGPFEEFSHNSRIASGTFLKGRREGLYTLYNQNGETVRTCLYRDDCLMGDIRASVDLPGSWELFDGNTIIERNHYNAKFQKDGVCQEFEDGVIRSVDVYHNDIKLRNVKTMKDGKMIELDEDGMKVYEGEFNENDVNYPRHGNGKEYEEDVKVYQGMFVNNVRNGMGKMFRDKRIAYDGNWKNGYPSGRGILRALDSNIYEGDWEFGYLHTKGKWLDYATGEFEEVRHDDEPAHWRERGGSPIPKQLKLDKPGSAKKKLWFTVIGIIAIIIVIIIVISILLIQRGPVISSYQQLINLDPNVQSITIKSGTCGEIEFTTFDIDRFTQLRRLIIQSSSLQQLRLFAINQLNSLQTITIESYVSSANEGSFRISNCSSLNSISIGSNSFISFNEFSLYSLDFFQLS